MKKASLRKASSRKTVKTDSPQTPKENAADSVLERFNALPQEQRDALSFLAIYTAPLRCVRVQELCGCVDLPVDLETRNVRFPEDAVRKHAWNQSRAKACLEKLQEGGWVDFTSENMPFCKESHREKIVLHLHKTGVYRKYAAVLFSILSGRNFYNPHYHWDWWSYDNRPKSAADIIREVRHLLITNKERELSSLASYIRQYGQDSELYDGLRNFFVVKDGINWLAEAKIEFRCKLLQYMLLRTISQLKWPFDDVWDTLVETAVDEACDPVTQILILDYALCCGKLNDPRLTEIPHATSVSLLAAHRAFVAGRYSEAAEFYRATMKVTGTFGRLKKAVLPFLAGVFHALAELNIGNRLSVLENAKYAISKADYTSRGVQIDFPMPLQGCWNLIVNIAEYSMGHTPGQYGINLQTDAAVRPVWLSILLSACESVWFQLKPVQETQEQLPLLMRECAESFPWLADEATQLCDSLGLAKQDVAASRKRLAGYRDAVKPVSLCGLFAPRDEWEFWLESLQVLADEVPKKTKQKAVKKEQPKTRLIWRIGFEYGDFDFIPCEQKWSVRASAWQEAKPMTLSRLFKSQGKFDFLTEQDREICAGIKVTHRNNYYGGSKTEYHFKDEIARHFAGHPLLFLGKTSTRVEIVESRPEISMQEVKGELHVFFSPPLVKYKHTGYGIPTDDSDSSFFAIKESKTRFKVVKLTKTEMRIRTVLGEKGRMFPKKAEAALGKLLGKLASDLSVKTDAKIEFENVPHVPCDSKIYIHLAPNGEGLQADFFVRPLGSESSGHRPGVGSERILGESGGKNVQTARNLEAERSLRKSITDRFPAFTSAAVLSDDQYVFESPTDALALLSELKDTSTVDAIESGKSKKKAKTADRDFEIYWPQGEAFSVSSAASFGNLSLSFASAEEWLSASGALKVDKETFDLQKLLAMLDDDSESRFVKISDRKFLALTNEFRKRLGDLKRLTQSKGKQLQLHPLAAAGLEDFFDAVPSLQKNATWQSVKKRIEKARNFEPAFPKDFSGDLRDYQLEGFNWLSRSAEWGVGCCLADDMGLGKTVQALALLLERASKGPALVVAPTSVCFNWEREAQRFAPTLNVRRIQSLGPGSATSKKERDKQITSAKKRDVVITSYTLLQQEIAMFEKVGFATVILDEAQAIKNPDSNRAKAAMRLTADFRLAMTGTPIENNLLELWSLFRFLNVGLLGSQKSFEDRFAVPVQRGRASGPRNTLRRLVQPFILRRTKSQVLDELPPRTEIVREIELSREESALYEAARINALAELENTKDLHSGKGRLQILAALTRLRQLCCNPKLVLPKSDVESSKLEAFREIVQELRENRHRVLVFSQFVKHLEILKRELDTMGVSYQYLDGSTPARERQKRVDAFQSGDYDAFLISIKAGGSGLNLTAADYVIHADPWWNPAVEDQATDRTHRIGQTRPVTVYRLITQGTIEEKIARLHHEKRNLADKLLEGTDQATKLSAEEMIEILRS